MTVAPTLIGDDAGMSSKPSIISLPLSFPLLPALVCNAWAAATARRLPQNAQGQRQHRRHVVLLLQQGAVGRGSGVDRQEYG